jgi:hypothetical protein
MQRDEVALSPFAAADRQKHRVRTGQAGGNLKAENQAHPPRFFMQPYAE